MLYPLFVCCSFRVLVLAAFIFLDYNHQKCYTLLYLIKIIVYQKCFTYDYTSKGARIHMIVRIGTLQNLVAALPYKTYIISSSDVQFKIRIQNAWKFIKMYVNISSSPLNHTRIIMTYRLYV
jgi:hypothetical protein